MCPQSGVVCRVARHHQDLKTLAGRSIQHAMHAIHPFWIGEREGIVEHHRQRSITTRGQKLSNGQPQSGPYLFARAPAQRVERHRRLFVIRAQQPQTMELAFD